MRPRRGRSATTFIVATSITVASSAGASPTAKLVYVRGEGAESCPDEASLRQSVAARLGYDPFRPFAESSLSAEVHREGRRFVGSVKLVDADGVERGARNLEGTEEDCDELTSSMALSMSIAIDPRSALKAPATPAVVEDASEAGRSDTAPAAPAALAAPASTAPPPSSEPPAHATSSRSPATSPAPRFAAGFGAYGTLGEAPLATAGARFVAEIFSTHLSAGLDLRADLPTTVPIAGGGAVRTSLVGAGLVPCWRHAWASICGVGFLGRAGAETVDVRTSRRRAFVHVAAGLRFAADIPLGQTFALRIAADVLGTIAPFVVEANDEVVYESSVVSGLAGATLLYRF